MKEAEAPLFTAKDTHSWGDSRDKHIRGSNCCPDIIFYPECDEAKRACTIEDKALAGNLAIRKNEEARTLWLWAALLIEAKSSTKDSPFVMPKVNAAAQPDPSPQSEAMPSIDAVSNTSSSDHPAPNAPSSAPTGPPTAVAPALHQAPLTAEPDDGVSVPFLRLDTHEGWQTMGQMAEYISKVLQRQFILFFFTVFVCCDYAWLLRWDRAGLVVSECFNVLDKPELLHRFIYRFACLNDVQRGRDPTVNPTTNEELHLLRVFDLSALDTDWQRDAFHVAFASGHPIYRIDVPQDDTISPADLKEGMKTPQNIWSPRSNEMRHFFVGKPYFTGSSAVGRGTRGHIAYDVSGNRLVFCKEYWCLDVLSHHREGDVLMHLHSKGVQYITTPIVAGDVRRDDHVHCTRS